jgi:Amt family ammonium transporter
MGAFLVFSMQAGFTAVEAGFVRNKNASNIAMKNVANFIIGSVLFWIVGFGLMFGEGGFSGSIDLFSTGNYISTIPNSIFLLYEITFCAVTVTIASGSMSGRAKFVTYCIFGAVMAAIIYPICGHWVWASDGFLNRMGFHDFAGGAVINMLGGVAAFVAAAMLGPRIGKYPKQGTSNAIQGHSMVLSAIGVFILWVGWFGLNGSATFSISGDGALETVGTILLNTLICGAVSGLTIFFLSWFRYRKADITMTFSGILGGLAAIASGCDTVTPVGALIIGIITAFILLFSIEMTDLLLKVDDPVGVSSVHGVCGAVGVLLTGFFATDGGLFYGGGSALLRTQLIGVLIIAAWAAATVFVLMFILKHTIGIRCSEESELIGLDRSEHGYIGNNPIISQSTLSSDHLERIEQYVHDLEEKQYVSDRKIRCVVIITRENKVDDLKTALNEIGISGMTVTNVLGCGVQRGHTMDYYRGIETDIDLLPKMRVEIVLAEVPLQAVIDVAKKVLQTGKVGDGKIFVYSVDNVIRIRTAEEGIDAL